MSSPRQFLIGLYREHLEEASSLFAQRRAVFVNPEIPWPRLAPFEDRFEAHIDALVIGADLALEVCARQALEGDAGELHAAVRVFCRQLRKDLLIKTLDGLDVEDADKVRAVREALSQELPAEWGEWPRELLTRAEGKFAALAAGVIGARRLGKGEDLLKSLTTAPPAAVPTILWALGRVRSAAARPMLLSRWLKHEDEATRSAAGWSLMRLAEPQAPAALAEAARTQSWAQIPAALVGGRSAVAALLDANKPGKATPEGLLALGLLGNVTAIPDLLEALRRPDDAPAAAEALHMLTGAGLTEEAVVVDPVDEAELFDHEKQALKEGKSPPGTKVTRLAQDPEVWKAWWLKRQDRFNPRARYRRGRLHTPGILLEILESEMSPHRLRQLAFEELVVRYGADFPFEADLLVHDQQRLLTALRSWVQTNASRFPEGIWFYAGHPST